MRNIYAHAYERVDSERVWEIIENDVPQLQDFCEKQVNAYNQLLSVCEDNNCNENEDDGEELEL